MLPGRFAAAEGRGAPLAEGLGAPLAEGLGADYANLGTAKPFFCVKEDYVASQEVQKMTRPPRKYRRCKVSVACKEMTWPPRKYGMIQNKNKNHSILQ
jgi:hypothetical protein